MKRTTYMIMGLLIAGLLIIIGVMVYSKYFVNTGGANRQWAITSVKTERIHAFKFIDDSKDLVAVKLAVAHSDKSGDSKLIYPKDMMIVQQKGDTLLLKLSLKGKKILKNMPLRERKNQYLPIEWRADSTVNSIELNNEVTAEINKLNLKQLSVKNGGRISLINCCFGTLNVSGVDALYASNSKIETIYLHLDNMDWSPSNCKIGTEYLFSTNKSEYVKLKKGECKRAILMPLKGGTIQVETDTKAEMTFE
jgi:hypothetical protein